MNKRVALALRIVLIALVVGGLWFFVRTIDWSALGTALATAEILPLVLVVPLAFVCLLLRAASWRIMLAPRYRVATSRLFRYTIAAYAASTIAPARVGEVLRIWVLKRRDGVPKAETAAVAIAERLVSALALLLLVAPVWWLVPGLPAWVSTGIATAAGIAVALFIALWILVGRVKADEHSSSVRRFIAGLHTLREPWRLLGAFGVLTLMWLFDLAMVSLTLYAVGIDLPVTATPLILFTLCLAITLPSTPAGIGAHQVGAMVALDLLHAPREPALAFALLYHALQVVPWTIAGLVLELNLVRGKLGPGRAQPGRDEEGA